MKYKACQTVFMSAYDDLFYYKLHEDDVISIDCGEWPELGFKITTKFSEIVKCIWFAILPFWFYESKKHYDCTYWQHLKMNLNYIIYILKIKK